MKVKVSFFTSMWLFLMIVSCQKEELTLNNSKFIENPELAAPNSTVVKTSSGDSIIVFVAPAPYPSLTGELQLGLKKILDYPVSVHFMIKENSTYGDNLFSSYYTIPAGQKYLICDIDEYTKTAVTTVPITLIDSLGRIFTGTKEVVKTSVIDIYLQICDVQIPIGNSNIMVDYSILKISHPAGGVSVSYSYKAYAFVSLSKLNCSNISFYKPTGTGGDGKEPIISPVVPGLPIE